MIDYSQNLFVRFNIHQLYNFMTMVAACYAFCEVGPRAGWSVRKNPVAVIEEAGGNAEEVGVL